MIADWQLFWHQHFARPVLTTDELEHFEWEVLLQSLVIDFEKMKAALANEFIPAIRAATQALTNFLQPKIADELPL